MSNDDERKLSIAQLQAVRDAVLSFAKLIREAYWVEGMQVPDEHPALRSILYRGFPALQKIERLTNPERLRFGTSERDSFFSVSGWPDGDRLSRILQWIANIRDVQIDEWTCQFICDSENEWLDEGLHVNPNYLGTSPALLTEEDVKSFEKAGKDLSDYLAQYADNSGGHNIQSSESEPALQPKEPALQLKQPSKEAFAAYRIHKEYGKKQTEIAKLLEAEFHRSICQGQVSKWCKEVKKWLTAGGFLPQESTTASTIRSVDPADLEMGKRTDGRTPRQREKRDDSQE